jgi:ubiquinone/menaquinone biosynthesis C-methylase UbiE
MTQKGHSEEYFGDYRDYWYNFDFLELMAKRWELDKVDSILDVGCGQCHWTKLLSQFLKSGSEIFAVDNDIKWSKNNEELNSYFKEQNLIFNLSKANATKLPFEDNSFDAITCQTVLIHLENPIDAVKEMKRVLKPNGILIFAEPNNLVSSILKNSFSSSNSIEEIIENFKFSLIKEKGKINLGKGDSSFGDLLPNILNQLDLKNIKSFISDKTNLIIPPYNTKEMQVMISQITSLDFEDYLDTETKDQFETFGNKFNDTLLSVNQKEKSQLSALKKSIENQTYFNGGGFFMYLISARK